MRLQPRSIRRSSRRRSHYGPALGKRAEWPSALAAPENRESLDMTSNELETLLAPDGSYSHRLPPGWLSVAPPSDDDEFEALELARRVAASDVGRETLSRLESAFDESAMAYPVSPPQELLQRVRKHSAYVGHLMDARMTLAEQRRLYAVGGWFQLLGATLHIDLHQDLAATARLQTAATLAQHAEHREIELGATRQTLGESLRMGSTGVRWSCLWSRNSLHRQVVPRRSKQRRKRDERERALANGLKPMPP